MAAKKYLINAIEYNLSLDSIKLLLDQIDDVNFGKTDGSGSDPNPIICLGHGSGSDKYKLDVLKELLSRGANVNTITSNTGSSAIMYFAQQYNYECVKFLIDSGADISIVNKYGYGISHYCSNQHLLDIVNKKSANIIKTDKINEKILRIVGDFPLEILKQELGADELDKSTANILLRKYISEWKSDKNDKRTYDFLVEKGANFDEILDNLPDLSKDLIGFLISKGNKISCADPRIKMSHIEHIKLCEEYESKIEELSGILLNKDKEIRRLEDNLLEMENDGDKEFQIFKKSCDEFLEERRILLQQNKELRERINMLETVVKANENLINKIL